MSKTALLFAGQGAQVVGMGKDLAEKYSLARSLFEKSDAILQTRISELCFNGPEPELTRTENAQPAIFIVSWIAFQLLKEFVPDLEYSATAGLSLGEITALTAAGALDFEDGLKLVRERGKFMQQACDMNPGSMAAVMGADVELVRAVCNESGVEIANLNCPGQIVISGDKEKIKNACEILKSRGVKRVIPLQVAGAYHSRLMEPARQKFANVLKNVKLCIPQVMVLSNATAKPHTGQEEIYELLVEQITLTVRWEDCMRYLLAQGYTRFIELGPGTVLSGFLKRIDNAVTVFNVSDAQSLEKTVSAIKGS